METTGAGEDMGTNEHSGQASTTTLTAEIQRVLARVDAHAGRSTESDTSAAAAAAGEGDTHAASLVAVAGPGTAPLEALLACFGLTPFERDLVLLAAAQELEPTTAARCAAACGDPERAYPTFSLALAALDGPHWSALTPVAPLRRWRIVELDDESRLTLSRLRLDERILHFLLGSPYLDTRLHGQLRRTPVPQSLPPAYDLAATRLAEGWTNGTETPLVELTGGDLRSRADIGAAAAARSGLGLYSMSAEDVPTDPAERDRLSRLWQREAILLPAALLVEAGDLDRDQRAATESLLAGAAVPVVVSSEDPLRSERSYGARIVVPQMDDEEQLGLWTDAFEELDLDEGELRSLVAQFQLPPHVVRSAAATVRRRPRRRTSWTPPNSPGGPGSTRPGSAWTSWGGGSNRRPAGATWSCTSGRRACCARSSRMCGSGRPSTRSGDSAPPCVAASASPPCSRAAPAPERPWPRR